MMRLPYLGLRGQVLSMSRITKTFGDPNLFEIGIGHVIITRSRSEGRLDAGVFLIDPFCLGVKNAFFRQFYEGEFEEFLDDIEEQSGPLVEHSGAWGRKLVEQAAAYARKLGFSPHRDYKKAAKVLGGIDPKECQEVFEFGCEGKPQFVAGPNDSKTKCERIIQILTRKVGKGGFHFIVPSFGHEEMSDFGEILDEDFVEDEESET